MWRPDHVPLPELDYRILDRELDRTKTQVFLGKSAAFYGSLMCALTFRWDKSIPTAATNGSEVMWNPWYFHFLCKRGRQSILMHEIRHVANLHIIRRGSRNPRLWNYAVDTVLDNEMDDDGFMVDGNLFPEALFPPGSKTFVNHELDGMSAEEIYDKMLSEAAPIPEGYQGDMIFDPKVSDHMMINQVVSATHSAKLSSSGAGDVPGNIELILKRFLKPKLPWKQLLLSFFNELTEQDYRWSRPNRRYSDMYLPSLVDEPGGLDHVMFLEDVSGSVTDPEIVRFNSEVKHVKDTYRPRKLSLVQFDTRITKETVYGEHDEFTEVVIVGRGGTSLVPVREHIIEKRPSAVVIFSDLECTPMEKLPRDLNIPILWVGINASQQHKINEGRLIHIRE